VIAQLQPLLQPRLGEHSVPWDDVAPVLVVESEPFIQFFPCNHIINIKKTILFPAKQKTVQSLSFFFCFIYES